MNYYDKPIPSVKDPAGDFEMDFIESPLVMIENSDRIDVAMQYPVIGCKFAETRCMARKELVDMLHEAAAKLPEGWKFRIWDPWRPFALQAELADFYWDDLVKEFHLEDLSHEEKVEFMSKFVATPIKDEDRAPAHTTGGAIDLTILDANGNELNMGTGFDAFTQNTRTDFYETDECIGYPDAEEIRRNRRLLHNIMVETGFYNLPSEWWHYGYGDKNWALLENKPVLYRGIWEVE